ncbi:hypothetical protein AVEN_257225-1 [Araneus ventricosus]|uniref:PLAT domain-containing protein n=1 Tax=Araneus ventricosus TaxID=182803 RepID=A0A4Y2TA92_ARAVE|nr:hypothetical protein AVEN_257225-1 [Araneus ventricosus]
MSPIVNSQEAKRFSVSRAQMLPIVNQTRAKSPREWLLPRVPKCPVWKRCEWPALLNSSVSRSREQVHFIISGEDDETDVRALADDQRPILQRGAINCFIMSVPRCLGQLNYLRIWHDNSGEGKNASWYLKHVVVKDIITGYKYEFIAERWFAVEEGDGLVRDFCESSFMNDEIRELRAIVPLTCASSFPEYCTDVVCCREAAGPAGANGAAALGPAFSKGPAQLTDFAN